MGHITPLTALDCFVFLQLVAFCQVERESCTLAPTIMAFLENHGKNIQLSNQNLTAARVSSYNQGLLVTAQPLARQLLFQVCQIYLTVNIYLCFLVFILNLFVVDSFRSTV